MDTSEENLCEATTIFHYFFLFTRRFKYILYFFFFLCTILFKKRSLKSRYSFDE